MSELMLNVIGVLLLYTLMGLFLFGIVKIAMYLAKKEKNVKTS